MPNRLLEATYRSGPPVLVLLASAVAAGLLLGGGSRPALPKDPAQLRAEIQRRAGDPWGTLELYQRLRWAGEHSSAFEVIAGAYDARSQEEPFAAAMAEALVETGQAEQALSLAGNVLNSHPESGDLRAGLAEALLATGRYSQALTAAEGAVRRAPSSPRCWRALARAHAANKRFAAGWPAFEKAMQLAPDDGAVHAAYGEALARVGRGEEALAALRTAARLQPRNPRVLTLLGTALGERAGDPASRQEALRLLRLAAELAPKDPEARYQLGRLSVEMGNAAEGAAALEEAVRLDSTYGDAYLPLAQAYRTLGRTSDAALAFAAYRRFSDFRREAAHLELRLRQAPESATILKRLGELNERHGRRTQALDYYRRAARLEPGPALDRKINLLEYSLQPR
jgi:cytochrome c-type biogenesis protein CcmH/NrfG